MKVLKGSIVIIVLIGVISYLVLTNHSMVSITLDSCIDGDTAWFIINGKKEKVRFLGIDAPEVTKVVEEYGIDASNYTCNMLSSAKDIYIEYDINSDIRDKYNRVLGWIFVDNKNLSKLLVASGLAEVKYIYGNYKYIDDLCDIQYEAYRDKLGIWNIYNYSNNYCYTRTNK